MPLTGIRATTAGYAAIDLVETGRDQVWIVHSVFRRAFNILTPEGRLLSFSTADVPPAPNNVVTDLALEAGWQGLGLTEGTPVRKGAAEVWLEDGSLRIALNQVTTFIPRIWGPVPAFPGQIPAMLDLAERCARDLGPREGFYPLLPFVEQLFGPANSRPRFDNLFCNTAHNHMADLVNAILSGDPVAIRDSTRGLVGLGPGLTPSGDDALAGLMMAMALTAKALRSPRVILEKVNPLIIGVCEEPGATGLLSQDFLRYAARGEGSSAAEDVIINILSGSTESVTASTARLIAIGASSGVDQLWGILTGIRLGLLFQDQVRASNQQGYPNEARQSEPHARRPEQTEMIH